MELSEHDEQVRGSFRRQVALFDGDDSVFATFEERARQWLGEVPPDSLVLDVACGAAHASEGVAPLVRQVVGVDLTRELLDVGWRRLRDLGLDNVLLQEGNAVDLPFVDDSFDLVMCRASIHHFEAPDRALAEMARVCRPDGRVVISDMVSPSAEVRDRLDDLHRLIDPSHVHALLDEELVAHVEAIVGPITHHVRTDGSMVPLDLFLTDQSDRPAVLDALTAELDGSGPATGFAPTRDGEQLSAAISTVVIHASPAVERS